MGADMNKLMHNSGTSQYRPVAYLNLSCNSGITYHDHIITYPAVVRHMNISHQKTVAPNNSLSLRICSAVQCCELPDGGVVTYFNGSLLTHEFQILRYRRNR